MVVKLRPDSHSLVNKAGCFDAGFEFFRQAAGIQNVDDRADFEGLANIIGQGPSDRICIAASAGFDAYNKFVQAFGSDEFDFKVVDLGNAKNEILKFRMIDIDAADFGKADGPVGMAHDGKN